MVNSSPQSKPTQGSTEASASAVFIPQFTISSHTIIGFLTRQHFSNSFQILLVKEQWKN